ncbi:MAG: type-F conjugative transfer system pilin assembly protein TrbC [Novosphingobium sp.]|nr:type-F conjugative transfer system pilin assembly protein TrbC [Novosphingobium sp.]
MKTSLQALAITALVASSAFGGALAQSSDPEIDLASIRARAADQTAEAEALAVSARDRAKAITADASQSADAGKANGRRYAGSAPHSAPSDAMFDFDKMVADAGDMARDGLGEAPRFIAFASLSMPAQALRQMMDDVTRAGGVVVFRGLTKGSAKVMTEALGKVLGPGERMDGVGIDPRLFRAFNISEVPAYIVTASDFDLCSGFDCTSAAPPFDRMNGNVTAEYALRTFASGGGPGARIAAQHLARLQGDQP